MNPKKLAEDYYKSLGNHDLHNTRRLRLAACAQHGRKTALLKQAKSLTDKNAPPDDIKVLQDEASIRQKHADKLGLFAECVDTTLKDREKLDKKKKP